ncbi:hypothetical protein [Komagataeibacter xylinus]|uniref:Uncharacterized protein n=1 Tax=Komagataeibacter xylinus TaxID=28448 RepID=A0A857FTC8_KOMXY|nr:hypothetical protein [Komagataeibacter xylinus]QHC37366.1 hypothetical protein FMA36_17330 [Komagataeibacter xylinus]
MKHRVTFATASKAAIRVTVQGKAPTDVNRFLLTGHGDEKDMEFEVGSYIADVKNLGSGEFYEYPFRVDASSEHMVLAVGRLSDEHSAWRSIPVQQQSPSTEHNEMLARSNAGLNFFNLRMRMPHKKQWRRFSGSRLENVDQPNITKLVRAGNWSEHPVVGYQFDDDLGNTWHSYVPLFSGGTLLYYREQGSSLPAMRPYESKSEAMVGSLSHSIRDEVSEILSWAAGSSEADAIRSIQHSRDDPWAAAAAALLLIRAGRGNELGSYVVRFAQRHPWMADAGIIAAWWQASRSNETECLTQLSRAREQGQIYYWNSLAAGEQLLSALGSGSKSTPLRAAARKELGRWKRMRSGAVNSGAFVVWPSGDHKSDPA